MKKRCFITPELRPNVIGSTIQRREWPIDNKNSITDKENLSPAILIIACEGDQTASHFENFVNKNGYSVKTISIEDPILINKFIHNLQIDTVEREYPGIYYRVGAAADESKFDDVTGVMHDLLTFYPGVIINRPSRLYLNYSKPLQMTAMTNFSNQVIKTIPTLITNLRAEIIKSPADKNIVKSISDIRSKVVDLTDQRLNLTGDFLDCPVQLQQKLTGVNIRVHVCGDVAYATRIGTDGLDYRYGEELSMKWIELPEAIETWCVQSAKREGLEFAGIDLLYQEKNNYYWCFEINPMPGYAFFEKLSGGEPFISKWLLNRLLS